MASTDLRFSSPYAPGQPTHLVFGDDGNTLPPGTSALHADGKITGMRGSFVLRKASAVRASGRVTGMRGSFALRAGFNAHATGQITGMRGSFNMRWDADVARGPRAALEPHWQQAEHASGAAGSRWNEAQCVQGAHVGHWQPGVRIAALAVQPWQQAALRRGGADLHWQESRAIRGATDLHWQEALRLRAAAAQHWQEGRARRSAIDQHWQEAVRLRAAVAQHWQESAQARASLRTGYGFAEQLHITLRQHWQEAVRPMPAPKRDVPPEHHTCWSPDLPANLLFQNRWAAGLPAHLVFACGGSSVNPEPGDTIVIPIQRTYIVLNSLALRRVSDGAVISASSFNMSLDVDSWTWSWSATIPGRELGLIASDDGNPVQVRATINNVPYVLLAEGWSRERSFGSDRINVNGRGLSALLDTPFAPAMNFGNSMALTASQLVQQVLTLNSASLGWDVDWGLTDWHIPAGAWSLQGSYMNAVTDIATAVGGYVQPHNTQQRLRILPRYPLQPWLWSSLTPDYQLPSDVVEVEGTEWVRNPAYNRVYVSGVGQGVNGEVVRTGTPGDLEAPMVTHAVITDIEAARQRGIAELSAAGARQNVTISLQVLPQTGLIVPGKTVRYVDRAGPRLGISRGVSYSIDGSSAKVRQSVQLEIPEVVE